MERRPLRGGGGGGSAAYDSHLENENDAQIAALAGKVGALKDISSQINIHIKGDNKMLDELDTSFDATGGLLGGVTKRLNVVANAAGLTRHCGLVAFVICSAAPCVLQPVTGNAHLPEHKTFVCGIDF